MARIREFSDIIEPTAAEEKLLANCQAGVPTVLGDGERPAGPSGARTVRAEVLRYLILGGCDDCRVDERSSSGRGLCQRGAGPALCHGKASDWSA